MTSYHLLDHYTETETRLVDGRFLHQYNCFKIDFCMLILHLNLFLNLIAVMYFCYDIQISCLGLMSYF